MALRLDDKKALVAEVAAVAATAQSVVAAEYRGLTVTQMTDLRAKARKSSVYLRVVKNTLARKAIAGTAFECVGKIAEGSADSRVLEGRPRRRGAAGQDVRQGPRQAQGDRRVAGRLGPDGEGPRQGRELADQAAGPEPAGGRAAGADLEVRAYVGRTAREAGADHRRRERPESRLRQAKTWPTA